MADRRARKKPPKLRPGSSSGGKGAVPKPLPVQVEAATETSSEPQPSSSAQLEDNFERELLWCIEQLQRGLATLSSRADQKKAHDGLKALKILQNPKTAVIKKRQVMRNSFGDYRKKMEAQMKQSNSAWKKLKMDPVKTEAQQKSTFLKKSQGRNVSSVEMDFKNLSVGSQEEFKFNFSCDGASNEAGDGNLATSLSENLPGTNMDQTGITGSPDTSSSIGTTDTAKVVSATSTNYFKMDAGSSSGFKFNFNQTDDT